MEIIIIVCLIVLLIAYVCFVFSSRFRVKQMLKKYSSVSSSSNLTGGQLVKACSIFFGIEELDVKYTEKEFADCYIPSKKLIVLSKENCFSNSLTAVCVASHEIGHAIQHKRKSLFWVLYNGFNSLSKLGIILILPVLILFVIALFAFQNYMVASIMFYILAGIFVSVILCKLLIIPCERNASSRALSFLRENHILKPSELIIARKILKNAGLTYVAELLSGRLFN